MEQRVRSLPIVQEYLAKEFPEMPVECERDDARDRFIFRVSHEGEPRSAIFTLEAVYRAEHDMAAFLKNRGFADRMRQSQEPVTVKSKDVY